MRRAVVITLVGCCVLAAAEPADTGEAAEPIRIVPIGDSITQGRKGGGKHARTFSYRYELWKRCVDAGIAVDFVGSLDTGFNGTPPYPDYRGRVFDNDHEGHWGWTSAKVAEKLPGWAEDYTPDIALVLLGTNDKWAKKTIEPTMEAHRSIVATLRKRNPEVVVLIGEPFQEWKPMTTIATGLRGLAEELTTERSPVVTVRHAPGWISKPDRDGTHTVDWVHPNRAGDAKLAANWFKALQPHLESSGDD